MKTLKGTLILFGILIILGTSRVTYVRAMEIYKNSKLTEKQVEDHCGMALTRKLYRWCYYQLDREPPQAGQLSRDED